MNREESLHSGLCRWLRMQYRDVIFNSDMSGVRLHRGLQAKVSRLRSSRAMPDITIYEMKHGFGGLLLELKAEGTRILLKSGSMTANAHIREQADILKALQQRGYLANFAVGIDEAMAVITWYLRGEIGTAYPGVNYLNEYYGI